jgi:hypothetical protein
VIFTTVFFVGGFPLDVPHAGNRTQARELLKAGKFTVENVSKGKTIPILFASNVVFDLLTSLFSLRVT